MLLTLSAQMCMAINLYKECRGASDQECQLINRVVINRMHETGKDACSVIFEKNQFSWTRHTREKLKFNSYKSMITYYKLNDSTQLVRAFSNVDKSLNDDKYKSISQNMTHYYDKSIDQPTWAKRMRIAYQTKNFVFIYS